MKNKRHIKIDLFSDIDNIDKKKQIAKKIAEKVENNQIIGFGSGSTSFVTAVEIAKKIEENHLNIMAVPTSYEMRLTCDVFEIPIIESPLRVLDWCFDGADEVDKNGWIIKGRGGAMFKEKMNIVNSLKTYILIDDTKKVEKLGQKFDVPVECHPSSIEYVARQLKELGAISTKLRIAEDGKDGPIITESGNFIIDTKFEKIEEMLEKNIKSIVGVIESGLFINYNNIEIVN